MSNKYERSALELWIKLAPLIFAAICPCLLREFVVVGLDFQCPRLEDAQSSLSPNG